MRILVSGGDSRFAKELKKYNTKHELILLDKIEMNILDPAAILDAILKYAPDVFIHCAALSRPMNVHDKFPTRSIALNIISTSNCVMKCIDTNVKFVYISTDYVYKGTIGNYSETDGVFPVNKYAWSKLGGECAAMLYDKSLILRMAMIEKPFPHKTAFNDLFKSCIWTSDAAKLTLKLIEKDATGIINIGGDKISIYDFVSMENNDILSSNRETVPEKTPGDVSMDLQKLKSFIDD